MSNPKYRRLSKDDAAVRFVDHGHLPAQHPDRVAQAHPVQRAEIGIENQYRVHRDHLLVVVESERLTGWCRARDSNPHRTGFEPAASAIGLPRH